MKVNRVRQNVFPVLAALIWGTAFVAQSVSADFVEPFTFNAARSAVAFLFLLVLCAVLSRRRRKDFAGSVQVRPHARRDLALGGLCCGLALTLATNLQQKGLETTTSGKAGFITALYIVIVPVAGLLFRRRVPRAVWLGVVLAVAGLYCLCITEDFTISAAPPPCSSACGPFCMWVFSPAVWPTPSKSWPRRTPTPQWCRCF